MNTTAYRTILLGAGLAVAWTVGGCDAGNEPDTLADEETYGAEEETYAAEDDTGLTEPETDPAADEPVAMGDQPGTRPEGQTMPGADGETMPGASSALTETNVVGQTVVSQDGEEIGTVVQVVQGQPGQPGQGQLAVVEVGEFLGIGEKQVAIEMSRLSMGADGQIRSDVTEDTLESMPEYDASAAPGQEGQQEMDEQGTQ